MYDFRPNLVIAFHGCDIRVRDKLLNSPNDIVISQKPYDWLGHGMYFWENNYERALQWAEDKKRHGLIETPAVIGAVLYLGYCCDLTDAKFIHFLASAYSRMAEEIKSQGRELPKNRDLPHDRHKDKLMRDLDCATIEYMHKQRLLDVQKNILQKGFSEIKIFDSTRGIFTEGGPAFEGSEIQSKTHTQLCIRNFNCIQGFFLPRRETHYMPWLEPNRPRFVA
jgi:hypothetical protein